MHGALFFEVGRTLNRHEARTALPEATAAVPHRLHLAIEQVVLFFSQLLLQFLPYTLPK